MTEKLIITSAVNYRAEDVRVLLRSAARHIPDASVIVMHERTDEEFHRALTAHNPSVHLVRPPGLERRDRLWSSARRRRRLKRMPSSRARLYRWALSTPLWPRGAAALHVVLARYFWALAAMEHPIARRARKVLLCDSRDVCVQADPFTDFPGKLVVGAWSVLFRDRPAAMNWLRDRYPEEIVRRVGSKHNLSNGTILGTREAIHEFLRVFTREMIQLKPHPFGQTGDQRLINVVLHGFNRVPFSVTPTGGPLMAHLIRYTKEDFALKDDGLYTLEGERICLVHHFEFHEGLARLVEREYGGSAGSRPDFHPVRPLGKWKRMGEAGRS